MTSLIHPLDRPVWSALSTRQRDVSLGDGRARRLRPEIGAFAAAADWTAPNIAALKDLIEPGGGLFLVEDEGPPCPPGLEVAMSAPCVQMVGTDVAEVAASFEILALGDADAPEMLALARLTEPGPFFERTHTLGAFVGVREGGRLVAMAGERMRPEGFTEVSGVCTHPDARGRGYAAVLSSLVARRIRARGETPFLHTFGENAGAIALYERLGFVHRRVITLTVLAVEGAAITLPH
jgi:ribosomal protein S18 acetylase RimI-like enzyme